MNKRLRSYSEEKNMDAVRTRNKNTIAALNELMKDTAFNRHRKTLDEVAKAMARSVENDQKWSIRCEKLQAQMAEYESKIKTAIQLSEEDKNVIDTLKMELENGWKFIEELKQQSTAVGDSNFVCSTEGCHFEGSKNVDSNHQVGENIEKIKRLTEEKYKLLEEVEKSKLQIFELEEELTNKEKMVEELNKKLNSKSESLKQFETETKNLKTKLREYEDSANVLTEKLKKVLNENKSNIDEKGKAFQHIITETEHIKIGENESENLKKLMRENDSLKKLLGESKKSNNQSKIKVVCHTKTESKTESYQMLHSLKRQLQDVNKRDQLSIEKLKHLMKKNRALSRALQRVKTQNNLMKLQLTDQTKMLNLLSSKCCKLEENDRKQARIIEEMERVRSKHVHMVGLLEQEIHTLKKEVIRNANSP